MRKLAGFLWRWFQLLLACCLIAWTALAIHFQFAPPVVWFAFAVLAAVAFGFLWLFG